jgi:hypothetical protein
MFAEIKKYENNSHFFFSKGQKLAEVSKKVPQLPGVYYIIKLAKGKIELVYIGKSGTISQSGKFKDQLLRGRLNNKQDGIKRQQFFDAKCEQEEIDALDIYWFVTFDSKHQDIPATVEGQLMQRFFDVHGRLPRWNRIKV